MTLDAWLAIGILAVTLATLLITKLPPVTVFLGALTLSMSLGLAPVQRSLIGFSNPGGLTVGALFMVAAGGNAKLQEINMFDPSWVGIPVAVLGVALLVVTSQLFLKEADQKETVAVAGEQLLDLSGAWSGLLRRWYALNPTWRRL